MVLSAILRASIRAGNMDTHLASATYIRMELSMAALDQWAWTPLHVASRFERGEGDKLQYRRQQLLDYYCDLGRWQQTLDSCRRTRFP